MNFDLIMYKMYSDEFSWDSFAPGSSCSRILGDPGAHFDVGVERAIVDFDASYIRI